MRKELDPERNELFFAKHVILVEGDTEKLAIPEYARRLAVNLDRLDVSIVEVGGKRSLKMFAEIIRSFGIPVTLVFDTDSSDFQKGEKDKENEYNKELRAMTGRLSPYSGTRPQVRGPLACGDRGGALSATVVETRRAI